MLFKRKTRVLFLVISFIYGSFMQASASESQSLPYKIINTTELKAILDTTPKDLQVVDARNPEEYEDVHIPGSINIPQKKFDEYAHLLNTNTSTRLIFYCNGVKCGKSKKAAVIAFEMGYQNVFVYEEGMPVWEEIGNPITQGPNYEAKIETTKISPLQLNDLKKSGKDDFVIVDVRDKSEYMEGHIPGAINIPEASFSSQSAKLDKNKTIIVYCNAGNRSYKAYRKLMKLSYKKFYQSLFADWKKAGFKIETGTDSLSAL